jgi:hypothetical protein
MSDLESSHRDRGHFVSRCTACGAAMITLPALAWPVRKADA